MGDFPGLPMAARLRAEISQLRKENRALRDEISRLRGDPTADEIWEMAKTNPQGVTRTQVSDLFSRNKKAREIDRALTALVEAGRLQRGEMRTGGAGRPAAVWRPICAAQAA